MENETIAWTAKHEIAAVPGPPRLAARVIDIVHSVCPGRSKFISRQKEAAINTPKASGKPRGRYATVDSPPNNKGPKHAHASTSSRKQEWTDERVMALFEDENGTFQHKPVNKEMVDMTGWPKATLERVRQKVYSFPARFAW